MSLSAQGVVVFSGSCLSLPLIVSLQQAGRLAGVVYTISSQPQQQMDSQQLLANLQQLGVPALQYNPTNQDHLLAELDRWRAEIGVVFSFGHLLPASLIDFFGGLLMNLHASELPDFRGSMPVYWQMRAGYERIVLTLHQVAEAADSGAIGLQHFIDLHPFDTFQSAHIRLMNQAPALVAEALALLQQGNLQWQPQRELADTDSQAPAVKPEDLQLHWDRYSDRQVVAMARAGNPNFGVNISTFIGPLQLMQASVSTQPCYGARPGTVLMIDKFRGWVIATRDGSVSLDVVIHQSGYFSGYQFAIANGFEAGMVLNSM
ncbi:methionyl-tRNA formyltransferase [Oceanobacter mangrovi]|uniref:methionyl-tRNA formyltransferase n=1 Tax=Oceanobacter mangrovi TaxID=2862510 RepID=UPI001C8DF1F4|nr:formyltransferase family protein [Oceanobacter mangrovi]